MSKISSTFTFSFEALGINTFFAPVHKLIAALNWENRLYTISTFRQIFCQNRIKVHLVVFVIIQNCFKIA